MTSFTVPFYQKRYLSFAKLFLEMTGFYVKCNTGLKWVKEGQPYNEMKITALKMRGIDS